MRIFHTRVSDATFDLNLAPMLDIIVSIVPMLLLGLAFLQVKMIETPVPQVVQEAIKQDAKQKETLITLRISKQKGFIFAVTHKGRKSESPIPLIDNELDYIGLQKAAITIKDNYPTVFRLDIEPEGTVELKEIVKAIDSVRSGPPERKLAFVDAKSGQTVETHLLFPNVSFGNVVKE